MDVGTIIAGAKELKTSVCEAVRVHGATADRLRQQAKRLRDMHLALSILQNIHGSGASDVQLLVTTTGCTSSLADEVASGEAAVKELAESHAADAAALVSVKDGLVVAMRVLHELHSTLERTMRFTQQAASDEEVVSPFTVQMAKLLYEVVPHAQLGSDLRSSPPIAGLADDEKEPIGYDCSLLATASNVEV